MTVLPLVVLALLAAPAGGQGGEAEAVREFGGVYSTLEPRQRELVEDLFRRFEGVTGKKVDPQRAYDSARLSVRTTFDAVTHALIRSRLTDAEGQPLGTALDLVEHLEAVHGRAEGAGGDQQFRIYVRMKPGALATLDRCAQFARGADNTIFHKGYPLSYRLQGGTPSVQISLTREGDRADIDVDYRSSKFPASLVNGHLTAANSDVRAGDNYDRHTGRWEGLPNWWRALFGLAIGSKDDYAGEKGSEREIPLVPPGGKKPIWGAAGDFLNAWLVERKPAVAMSYVSERALACLALERDPEAGPVDYGLAPVELLVRMQRLVDRLPPVKSLSDVVIGSRLSAPRLTPIRHDQGGQFVLYGVPDAVAREFDCASRGTIQERAPARPRMGAKLEDFGYFGTSLYIRTPDQRGATLLLLWAKESGYWKVVSYDVEPEGDEQGTLAEVYEAPQLKPVVRVPGDQGLIDASAGFLEAWLVRKDYERAFSYFAPSCYPCVDLFRAAGEAAAGNPDAQAAELRRVLAAAGDRVGSVARLEDVIAGVEPVDPQAQVLIHPREAAFGLFSIDDQLAKDADCRRRLDGAGRGADPPQQKTHGTHYATALRFRTAAGEPAVLYLGWTRVGDAWRIFAYDVQTP